MVDRAERRRVSPVHTNQSGGVRIASMGLGYVDATQLTNLGELSSAELARRYPRRDGNHFWVMGMIYTIDDPEDALDHMTLETDNLLGFYPIHCLHCRARYPSEQGRNCLPPDSPFIRKGG